MSPNATKNKARQSIGVKKRWYKALRYDLLSHPGPCFLRRVVVVVWPRLQGLGPGVALACLRVAEQEVYVEVSAAPARGQGHRQPRRQTPRGCSRGR